MGFGRIEGPPNELIQSGLNRNLIHVHGGRNNEHPSQWPVQDMGKTGGILSVDGVLYAWLNLQDNTWPQVDMDGTHCQWAYLDGIEVASAPKSGTLALDNSIPVWVGANPTMTGDGPGFRVVLDEVRIYNRALSASEISTLLNHN